MLQFARGAQCVKQMLDEVLHGQHRLQTPTIESVHACLLGLRQERPRLYPGRLVGHIGLVVRRRAWRLGPWEGLAMTRRWRCGLMRRIGRYEEEERSLVSRDFTDEVRRLAREHIGEVVLRLLPVVDQGA